MMTLNFEKFEDGCDLIGPIRLIPHFGWFKGNYFLKLMESSYQSEPQAGQALSATREAGDGIKPGVERSEAPGSSSQKFAESAKRPLAV